MNSLKIAILQLDIVWEEQQKNIENIESKIDLMDEKNPLLAQDANWEGWEFGRDLFKTEIVSLIQQIPSVKYVLDVEVLSRPVVPMEENSIFDDSPEELSVVDRVLRIPEDGLLCSLDHEIEIVEFSEMEKEN